MSGPALTQFDSHHAIHQAAFAEAERLTYLLRKMVGEESEREAAEVADILVEHWETRTLRHAEAEEEGLYRDVVHARPDRAQFVERLQRDHDLLRQLLLEIRQILAHDGWRYGVAERFEAMLLLNGIHSRDEEAFLFPSAMPVKLGR